MTRPQLILPVGTRIVTRVEVRAETQRAHLPVGAVGEIVQAPLDALHSYRVRFTDGAEASLRRDQFSLWNEHRALDGGRPSDPLADHQLRAEHIIYRCIVGSRAYGLDGPDSDTDRRGVFLPPAELHWSLYGVPEQIENDATQECYWELQKFLDLALKANPNALECLYTPLVEHATEMGRELLAIREAFLSKLVYQTFNGYVLSQFKKLEQDVRARGEVRWKHVMHMIRLLLSGIGVLRTGAVPVRAEEHRAQLLAIRNGQTPWDEVDRWRLELHQQLDAAYATTRLPERPDYARVNSFLIRARLHAARELQP